MSGSFTPRWCIAFVFGLAALLGLGGATNAHGGVPPLERRLTRLLEDAEVRGASIRVAGARPLSLDWGARDGDGAPVTPDTRFRAGSVSKLVTSLLVLRAEAAGVLSLDDPVERYISDLFESADDHPGSDAVRVVHLLEHTAGLPNLPFADYAGIGEAPSPGAYLAARRPFVLQWPPGTHFAYSNVGHTIAARIVELAWGESFDTLVEREVFGPLGMTDSSFAPLAGDPHLSSSFAAGEVEALPTWSVPVRPSGSLITTANDLMRMLDALVDRGRLPDGQVFLPPSTIDRMERSETSLAARAGAGRGGYGLGNFFFRVAGQGYRGHWGKVDGFLSTVAYRRDPDHAFVILLNTPARRGSAAIRRELARSEVALHREAGDMARSQAPPAPLASRRLRGVYVQHSHAEPIGAWLVGLVQAKRLALGSNGEHLLVSSPWPLGGRRLTFDRDAPGLYRLEGAWIPTATLSLVDGDRFWTDGDSYRQISALRFYLEWIVLLGGVLTAASVCMTFSIGWLWTGRRRARSGNGPTALGPLAIASGAYLLVLLGFVGLAFAGDTADRAFLGQPSLPAIGLAAASVVAPVGVGASAIRALRSRRRPGPIAIAILLLAALGCQLAVHGWLPLLTW